MQDTPPQVYVFSAFDGTGGAGALLDCAVLKHFGCLPVAILTGNTAQNLDGVQAFWKTPSTQIRHQLESHANIQPAAVKVGVIGNAAPNIKRWLSTHGELQNNNTPPPLVWDPVLSPTHGKEFSTALEWKKLQQHFLPLVYLATPNRQELLTFSGENRVDAAVQKWLEWGVQNILVTDIGRQQKIIEHALYTQTTSNHPKPIWKHSCPRLPNQYHGTGCFLSSAITAGLAHGQPLEHAIESAQSTTEQAIQKAMNIPTWGKQFLLRV